jgi:2-methylcitrate dehydratase PrpD
VVLHDRVLTLAQFEPARYNDPKLTRFAAEQVETKVDPSLTGVQSIVEADLADGKTVAVRCEHSKGSPENPLSRSEIENKFRFYGKGVLPAARIEEAIAAITRLEDLKSVRSLMDLLRTGEEQRRKSA